MIRTLLAAVAALSLSGCAGLGDSPGRRSPLKIASWNLEHLAAADGQGCRPRTEADYALLKRHVAALDADVIAFQEVQDRAAAERVFDPARYTVVMSMRPASGRGGACRGQPDLAIQHQAVGFAVRKGLRWRRHADVTALGLGDPDLRWGVDLTIDHARPIRLLAVHLKSGCPSGRSAEDPDCPILFAQASALGDWTDERARKDEAFMVLGDWNRRVSQPGDAFLAAVDDEEPAKARLTIAAGDRSATCDPRYTAFIDHIVAGADAAARIVPGSFEEYVYGGEADEAPSDHCPVSVRVSG